VLLLPDVAELVRDQVVGGARPWRAAEEDGALERVAVVASELRQPEEPRGDQKPDPVDPDRTRVVVEPIESRLRAVERCGGGAPSCSGAQGVVPRVPEPELDPDPEPLEPDCDSLPPAICGGSSAMYTLPSPAWPYEYA
jgi:hypothetical protein